jgi:heme a synthase
MPTRNGIPNFSSEMRTRHRFSVLAVLSTVLLIAWGGFVTSIDAGLAVPDWPSSFNSYDPFNPWPQWWTMTPVLAEHGHRLVGALVGLFTLALAVWTLLKEPRGWIRKLAVSALVLVILQGTLGGLRVVLVSLDLAVVHACLAQIFFSLMVCLALFTSRTWLEHRDIPMETLETRKLRRAALITTAALYIQIILGALLRHPGTGIDPALAGIHILGALTVTGLIIYSVTFAHRKFRQYAVLRRTSRIQAALLVTQFALGLTAYLVLLDEQGMTLPSNLQVIVNTTHLVVGALLLATTVVFTALVLRRANVASGDSLPAGTTLAGRTMQPAGRL